MAEHNLETHFVVRPRVSIAMVPADFMAEIVLPTVLELRHDPRSRRHAYLACIAAFHVKDHLKAAGEKGIENALRSVAGPAFDVVRGVCNGTKYVRTKRDHVIAFVAGDDWDRPPATCDEMECGVSELGDETGGRSIDTADGSADLYDACAAVLRAYVRAYPQHFRGCDLSGL